MSSSRSTAEGAIAAGFVEPLTLRKLATSRLLKVVVVVVEEVDGRSRSSKVDDDIEIELWCNQTVPLAGAVGQGSGNSSRP